MTKMLTDDKSLVVPEHKAFCLLCFEPRHEKICLVGFAIRLGLNGPVL